MGGGSFVIDYEAESIGTRIFLILAMIILDNHHNSKLFLIDDFDYNELSITGIKKSYQDGLYGADQIINDSMIKDILL